MFKFKYLLLTLITSLILITNLWIKPINSQVIPSLNLPNNPLIPHSKTLVNSACIYLDGRCIFELSTGDKESLERISQIQNRLDNFSKNYLRAEINQLNITKKIEGSTLNLFMSINDQSPIRLLTITAADAQLKGVNLEARADQLIEVLHSRLQQAKNERTKGFLTHQMILASGIILIIILCTLLIRKILKFLKQTQPEIKPNQSITSDNNQVISELLIKRKIWNFKEVQLRIFQLLETLLIGGGTIIILGLFPYTRMIQLLAIVLLQYPLRLGIVAVFTYLLIRLSYGLIAQFNSVLALNSLISPEGNRRLQLRINTISVVIRGIITATWIIIGTSVGLAAININITPLLAGAGIIGLAISFASQNLIKDAINGFCIILEDQYAVGDMINIGTYKGLVEYINLRITQIRDSEGKLITIPNSEVRIVANLSSHWARADLNITVAYNADIDQVLGVIKTVANHMSNDVEWKDKILEKPAVLGIENFSDLGMIIKVLIKTEPLKQWEVSREFRRRIKIAFDQENIPIPVIPKEVFLHQK